VIGWLAWVPLVGIVAVVRFAGGLPIAALAIPPPGPGPVVVAYGALGLAILARTNPFSGPALPLGAWIQSLRATIPTHFLVPGIALPAAVLGVILFQRAAPVDQIRFLAVTGADAALITFASGPISYLQGTADATSAARAIDPVLPLANRAVDLALLTVTTTPRSRI
jgi:hypothetical protein